MPKLVFFGLSPADCGTLLDRLLRELDDKLAKEVLWVMPEAEMGWLVIGKPARFTHVEVRCSMEMDPADGYAIARVCARYMDVELYLPSGQMQFFEKGSTVGPPKSG